MKHTEIIAEVGECFNGDFNRALKMIAEAKTAGCDVVKFQLLDMDEVSKDDPEYEWFSKLDLSLEKITKLISCAKDNNIQILFTPVSVRTAELIFSAGLRTVKIASSFVNKMELLEYINSHFNLVYASTGMAGLDEIQRLVETLDKVKEVRLLHCISEYPTGPLLDQRGLCALDEKDVHMNMMCILKDIYPKIKVGYSDHTDGILAPIVAVAMGADIIEKHFTLDKETPLFNYNMKLEYMGTDHVLSVETDSLTEMVNCIRRTEKILGRWEWKRSEGEIILRDFLRGRYIER